MARLVPADEIDTHLSKAKGWLEDDDPFFDAINTRHFSRIKALNFENWSEQKSNRDGPQ